MRFRDLINKTLGHRHLMFLINFKGNYSYHSLSTIVLQQEPQVLVLRENSTIPYKSND